MANTPGSAPDLSVLAAGVAEELGEVTSSPVGDAVAYARGGVVFAHVSSSVLEVRLPADIAEAALLTPDTAAGEPGWLRFTPADDERHVIDRATAWFQTAWRHAGDK